jgi:hypothetical protein
MASAAIHRSNAAGAIGPWVISDGLLFPPAPAGPSDLVNQMRVSAGRP